ncbi:MAG: hypothetical protein KGL39_36995 [Patescibacteria group bacterium]|nr:hypothetical protein [Patescibacteria group bacterium]
MAKEESLPIRVAMWARPQETVNLIAKWMQSGVPLDGLALHFDRDWLVGNYIRWLHAMRDDFRANFLRISPGERAVAKPVFRNWAWDWSRLTIRWDSELPFETNARRAITDLGMRLRTIDAVDAYYARHPEIKAAHRRKPNNPKWERSHPEIDWSRDWMVSICKVVNSAEKDMLGWRDGDDWRSVLQRRIDLLEATGHAT